ncbi:MAG: thymidine kinase [Candidatus Aenigmarchaeota archaeon]|nr:thymidine kinase [Candidatus Aenigmarchaeota archaeon]
MVKSTDHHAYLEVITGAMFSGKTRELHRQYSVFKSCQFNVQVFKRDIDDRYGKDEIKTHDGLIFDGKDVFISKDVNEIEKKIKKDTDVLMVDEAQFYGSEIVEKADKWINNGKIVVLTLLPTDYRGMTFGPAGDLLAKADKITQVFARCLHYENGVYCHKPATRTFRTKSDIKEVVVIGGSEMYEPRCRQHHFFNK